MTDERETRTGPPRRYVWPWFVLAAVLAAILLAMIWLSVEIERTRLIRELNTPGATGGR